jgi:hypothetical protein
VISASVRSCVNIYMAEDAAILYQLENLSQNLCSLCAVWEAEVQAIPCMDANPNSWGPSDAEILSARIPDNGIAMRQGDWTANSSDDDSDYDRCPSEEGDDDLLEALEAATLADVQHEDSGEDDDSDILGENLSTRFLSQPQKRHYREDSVELLY